MPKRHNVARRVLPNNVARSEQQALLIPEVQNNLGQQTSAEMLQSIILDSKKNHDSARTRAALGMPDQQGMQTKGLPGFDYWQLDSSMERGKYWAIHAACCEQTEAPKALLYCLNSFAEYWQGDSWEQDKKNTPLSIVHFPTSIPDGIISSFIEVRACCSDEEQKKQFALSFNEFSVQEVDRFMNELVTVARLSAIEQCSQKEKLFLQAAQELMHSQDDACQSNAASSSASSSVSTHEELYHHKNACIMSDLLFQYPKLIKYFPEQLDLNKLIDSAIVQGSPFAKVLPAVYAKNKNKAQRILTDLINDSAEPLVQMAARAKRMEMVTGIPQFSSLITNFIIKTPNKLNEVKPLLKAANLLSREACKEKVIQLSEGAPSRVNSIAKCVRLRMEYDDNSTIFLDLLTELSKKWPHLIENASKFFQDDKRAHRTFWQVIFTAHNPLQGLSKEHGKAAFKLFEQEPDVNNYEQYTYLLSSILGGYTEALEKAFSLLPFVLSQEKKSQLLKALVKVGYKPAFDPFYNLVHSQEQTFGDHALQENIKKELHSAAKEKNMQQLQRNISNILLEGNRSYIKKELQLLAEKGHVKAMIECVVSDGTMTFAEKKARFEEKLNGDDETIASRYACALIDIYTHEINSCKNKKSKKRKIDLLDTNRKKIEERLSSRPYLARHYMHLGDIQNAQRLAESCADHLTLYNIAIKQQDKDLPKIEDYLFSLYKGVKEGRCVGVQQHEVDRHLLKLAQHYIIHQSEDAAAFLIRLTDFLLFCGNSHKEVWLLYKNDMQAFAQKQNQINKIASRVYADAVKYLLSKAENTPEVLADIAECSLQMGSVEEADNLLTAYLENGGDSSRYMVLQGRLHMLEENFAIAAPLLLSAYKENAAASLAHIMSLFKKCIAQRSPEGKKQAQSILDSLVPLARDKDQITIDIMHELLGERNKAEARLRQWPAESNALFHLALISKDPLQAKKYIKTACKIFPNHSDYMMLLATKYNEEGNIKKALPLFNAAARLGNELAKFKLALYCVDGTDGENPSVHEAVQQLQAIKGEKLKAVAESIMELLPLQATTFWQNIPKENVQKALQQKVNRYSTNYVASDENLVRIRVYQNPVLLAGIIKNKDQLGQAKAFLREYCDGDDLVLKCNAHLGLSSIYAKYNKPALAINHLKKTDLLNTQREVPANEWKAFYGICLHLLNTAQQKDYKNIQQFIYSVITADQAHAETIDEVEISVINDAVMCCKKHMTSQHDDVKDHATKALGNMYYQLGTLATSERARQLLCREALSFIRTQKLIDMIKAERMEPDIIQRAYMFASSLLFDVSPKKELSGEQKDAARSSLDVYKLITEKGSSLSYYHGKALKNIVQLYSTIFIDEKGLWDALNSAEQHNQHAPFYVAALAYSKGVFGQNKLDTELLCLEKALQINPKDVHVCKRYTFLKYTKNEIEHFSEEQTLFIELVKDALQQIYPGKSMQQLTHEEQLEVLNNAIWPT